MEGLSKGKLINLKAWHITPNSEPQGPLFQMINKRACVRQHIMHPRLPVGRFGHGAEENDAHIHQPLHGIGRMFDQQPAQLEVVFFRKTAVIGKQRHVLEVSLGSIVNALGALKRSARGCHRTDRANRRAAERCVFFEQDHTPAKTRRFDRGGQSAAAATDHHDIKGFVVVHLHNLSTAPSEAQYAV
jgi:hypothetical protein